MRNCKILALCAIAALCASCAPKTKISMTVDGAAGQKLAIHRLNVSASELLDSVKTDANGHFNYTVDVKKGDPEFIYVFKGDTRLAALLLEAGQKAVVSADTLGNYTVEGSEGSNELREVENDYASFLGSLIASESSAQASQLYVQYYRSRVSYVMGHPYSLSCVPVFFQNLSVDIPVFSRATDAIIFRSVTDSLKTVYPDSRYVKALERETERRENNLGLKVALEQAKEAGFPEINLPNTSSEKVSLTGVQAKAILVHFWDASDATQSLFNTEVLAPIYNEYHKKGFEIYSVCLSTDKAAWASVVRNQNLPWINVCDGQGAYCPAVRAYNVSVVPTSILIANGEIATTSIKGEAGLRAELKKILK